MSGPEPTPRAEVEITADLVQALLRDQHPDLADRSLVEVGSGWDNALFRLGDDLVVRLPRRALGAGLVAGEQRWLSLLAPMLPLPIPVPIRYGVAGQGYPWSWSICPWFEGGNARDYPPSDPLRSARALGGFLRALHVPAPDEAPRNRYRGVPLIGRNEVTRGHLASLEPAADVELIRRRWQALQEVPPWSGRAMWIHGDLHPTNIIVRSGEIAAVVDFGDVTAGDPATDLAVAWMLALPPDARSAFRQALGDVDDDTWERGKGWALSIGLAMWATAADDPAMTELGRRTVTRLIGG